MQYSWEDAEESADDEEGPTCEGRCDVHSAATGAALFSALHSSGAELKKVHNNCRQKHSFMSHLIQEMILGCSVLWREQTRLEAGDPRLN